MERRKFLSLGLSACFAPLVGSAWAAVSDTIPEIRDGVIVHGDEWAELHDRLTKNGNRFMGAFIMDGYLSRSGGPTASLVAYQAQVNKRAQEKEAVYLFCGVEEGTLIGGLRDSTNNTFDGFSLKNKIKEVLDLGDGLPDNSCRYVPGGVNRLPTTNRLILMTRNKAEQEGISAEFSRELQQDARNLQGLVEKDSLVPPGARSEVMSMTRLSLGMYDDGWDLVEEKNIISVPESKAKPVPLRSGVCVIAAGDTYFTEAGNFLDYLKVNSGKYTRRPDIKGPTVG